MSFDFHKAKTKARRLLHGTLSRPALYYPVGVSDGIPCTVRVHSEMQNEGDLAGTNLNYAENVTRDPSLVFLKEEVMPQRNAAVILSHDEGYYIDHREPIDGITVRAFVVRMAEDEARTFDGP